MEVIYIGYAMVDSPPPDTVSQNESFLLKVVMAMVSYYSNRKVTRSGVIWARLRMPACPSLQWGKTAPNEPGCELCHVDMRVRGQNLVRSIK